MVCVGGLLRHAEAEQRHHRAGCVGEVVQRVCGDGDRACEQRDGELPREQQQVADDADRARQLSDGGVDGGGVGIFMVFYEQPQQQLGHIVTSVAGMAEASCFSAGGFGE